MTKVRFAPSPTGNLHIGGARTALFNWLYAKSTGGKMVLRIEDTDQERSKDEYVQEILASMEWLGMDWDELHYQSKRFDIYREYADKLLKEEKAYKDGEAVILKIPQKEIKIYDLIRDEIVFDSELIKDQVLMKSDGSPTYSFACVIDDALMEITCVIRGEDHISNTPKQIMIYEALGMKPPKYAHLPLIMGEDGTRLSKRTGAVAVSDYKAQGFLPEALVNYLLLLGWAPGGNQEKIELINAVKKFSIKKVNKTSACFSMDKLKWLNGEYIKSCSTEDLFNLLVPLLKQKSYISEDFDSKLIKNSVELFQGRISTLLDYLEWADFLFIESLNFDEQAKKEHLTDDKSKEFNALAGRYQEVEPFDAKHTEDAFRELVGELGLKPKDLVHPVRVALTGRAIGPSLFETIALLGKKKTVQRLKEAFTN